MLKNIKMPTIVGILTFMSRINFVLSCVEYEKNYITSEPGLIPTREQILCMYVVSANDSAIFLSQLF